MVKKLTVIETLNEHGFEDFDDWYENGEPFDSIVPCCCSECLEIEPDGHCQHGYPSILLALGVI